MGVQITPLLTEETPDTIAGQHVTYVAHVNICNVPYVPPLVSEEYPTQYTEGRSEPDGNKKYLTNSHTGLWPGLTQHTDQNAVNMKLIIHWKLSQQEYHTLYLIISQHVKFYRKHYIVIYLDGRNKRF